MSRYHVYAVLVGLASLVLSGASGYLLTVAFGAVGAVLGLTLAVVYGITGGLLVYRIIETSRNRH